MRVECSQLVTTVTWSACNRQISDKVALTTDVAHADS